MQHWVHRSGDALGRSYDYAAGAELSRCSAMISVTSSTHVADRHRWRRTTHNGLNVGVALAAEGALDAVAIDGSSIETLPLFGAIARQEHNRNRTVLEVAER